MKQEQVELGMPRLSLAPPTPRTLRDARYPKSGYRQFIQVIDSCRTVAIETQIRYGT